MTNDISYFIYARKSSEDKGRQVQSIDDQKKYLRDMANRLGLKVIRTFEESKSAKAPSQRPFFQEMMELIAQGKANGILCWKIDRLSRNPIDSGQISWMLQNEIIKCIQTSDKAYLPSDNILMLTVENGMANQYLRDLSANVKRGMNGKYEKGWLPTRPPLGYINDRAERIIVTDRERFNLIRKMWDLMLTGTYTPPKILQIANEDWGFRTVQYKQIGGNKLSRSGIYKIFNNIYYAGLIPHNGIEHKGKHERMITIEEFDRVQSILGSKGKPRAKRYEFAFTGMIRCAECGCLYTAETKTKFVKSINALKSYTFYHCTRKKIEANCSQRKYLKEEDLESQIVDLISKVTIRPQFKEWALKALSEMNEDEIMKREAVFGTQEKALKNKRNELDNLTRMRCKEMIDDEEFLKEKNRLKKELRSVESSLANSNKRTHDWFARAEKIFDFATNAKESFMKGDLHTKKEILMTLGYNFSALNGKLTLDMNEWFIPIIKSYPKLESEYIRLELQNNQSQTQRKHEIDLVRSSWFGDRDSNPD